MSVNDMPRKALGIRAFSAIHLLTVLSIAVPAYSADELTSFLREHCHECHGATTSEAGLSLSDVSGVDAGPSTLAILARAHDRVQAGEMPPDTQLRPDTTEVQSFLQRSADHLTSLYDRHYRIRGRVPARRLNPVEFEYTLRDLLATPWLQIRDILPPERSMFGFDNIAEAQEFSYVQMARYLEAIEVAIDSAMMLGPRPESIVADVPFGETRRLVNRDGWAIMLRQPNSAQAPWRISNKRQHESGWYRFRVHCKAVHYENGVITPAKRQQVAAINTAAKRFLHTFDVTPEPSDVEFVAWQNRDELLEFYCASLSDRQCPKDKDETPRPFKGDGVAVDRITIEGPFAGPSCNSNQEPWPGESYRRLCGELPTERWTEASGLVRPEKLHIPDRTANKRGVRDSFSLPIDLMMVVSNDHRGDAQRLLRTFMRRVHRGEFSESEFERCFAFALQAIERRACFQDVMRAAYKAVLSSPDFLYLKESPGELSGSALASRLSYFLWRSTPDSESLAGLVNEDESITRALERMLGDPRCARFVSDFCGQWLDLRELHDTSPDRYLFPEYWGDVHLVDSSRQETEATFAEMIANDLPVINAVAADFVMINQRLAELYNIPHIEGVRMRKVHLPPDSPRGGFLTQSSVLKVTANGLTTSPVIRGAWILDRILGTPAPLPPPNVGSIEPDTRGTTTVREQLEKHRGIKSCASCHSMIDPPGFALESFDVMGGWRDRYRISGEGTRIDRSFASKDVSFHVGPKVDASGIAPNGNEFDDYVQFRDYLAAHEEQIARNLVQRLLTFATGGGITFADRDAVETILQKSKSSGYGLRTMIREIVLSPTFRNK